MPTNKIVSKMMVKWQKKKKKNPFASVKAKEKVWGLKEIIEAWDQVIFQNFVIKFET